MPNRIVNFVIGPDDAVPACPARRRLLPPLARLRLPAGLHAERRRRRRVWRERELAAIYVAIIPDRPGQLLRQALQQRFEGDRGSAEAALHPDRGLLDHRRGDRHPAGHDRDAHPDDRQRQLDADRADPAQTVSTNGFARAEDAVNIIDQQYFAADLQTEAAYQLPGAGNGGADQRLGWRSSSAQKASADAG